MPAGVPQWFDTALASPVEARTLSVAGCRIAYRRWGAGRRGVLLVHGGGAHSRWWDHVAPWLVTPERCVLALDMSGHGDSGHRAEYSLELWAEEMLAAGRDADLLSPPVLAGHSLGGWATTVAAADHPDEAGGLILMDSRVIDPTDEMAPPPAPAPRDRPFRVYPTRDEITARYRPEPVQDGNLPYVVAHLAEHSVRPVDGGWTWKFDPGVLVGHSRPGAAALGRVRCPSAIIRGERGLMTAEITADMTAALGQQTPVIDVPSAAHHLMLDQPLALVTGLRAVMEIWERTGDRTSLT